VVPAVELARHRQVVSAFLTAARAGDLTAVLAVLAADVVRRADPVAVPPGVAAEPMTVTREPAAARPSALTAFHSPIHLR
jgi:hypothetical protein